jgi:hypothetical protein
MSSHQTGTNGLQPIIPTTWSNSTLEQMDSRAFLGSQKKSTTK